MFVSQPTTRRVSGSRTGRPGALPHQRGERLLERLARPQRRRLLGEAAGLRVERVVAHRLLDLLRGDGAAVGAGLVDDRQSVGRALHQPLDHLVQGRLLAHRERHRLHRVAHGQQPHQIRAAAAHHVDPAPAQLQRVDRVAAQPVRDAGREHDREHQRQDDPVLAGQLEDDDHRRDRRAGGRREDGAHPDEPVRAGRCGRAGRKWWTPAPYALPSIAPMKSEGAKTPPEPPIEIVRLVARIFPASSANRNQTAQPPRIAFSSGG